MPTASMATLNSVEIVSADSSVPRIKADITVYDSACVYSIKLKSSGTVIISTNFSAMGKGKHRLDKSLTSSQRSSLLNAIGRNRKSITVTCELITYSSDRSENYGSTTLDVVIGTSADLSKPIFSDFTYEDTDNQALAVTNNNQIIIQNQSSLDVFFPSVTPRNGARIKNYSITLGQKTSTQTVSTQYEQPVTLSSMTFGTVSDYSENMTVKVTVTDTRGYSTSVTKPITVLKYQPVSFDSWNILRVNQSDVISVSFTGKFSPLIYEGTDYNPPQQIYCKYCQKDTASWQNLGTLSITFETDGSFSYSNVNLVSLDVTKSYTVRFYTSDVFHNQIGVDLTVGKATPTIALREGKVGINKISPQCELDVSGVVNMNGFCIQGYVGILSGSTDLNTITDPGIYVVYSGSTQNHCPSNARGILEVLRAPNFVVHRYISNSSITNVYVRSWFGLDESSSSSTWTAWNKLT